MTEEQKWRSDNWDKEVPQLPKKSLLDFLTKDRTTSAYDIIALMVSCIVLGILIHKFLQ